MSGKIVEYKMLNGWKSDGISEAVNQLLSDGWKLYGTPFSDAHGSICQAMVKEVYNNHKDGKR